MLLIKYSYRIFPEITLTVRVSMGAHHSSQEGQNLEQEKGWKKC